MSSVFTTVTHPGGIATPPMPFITVTQTGGIPTPPRGPTIPLFATGTAGTATPSAGDLPGNTSLSALLPQSTAPARPTKSSNAMRAGMSILFFVLIGTVGVLLLVAIGFFFHYRRKRPEDRPALLKKMHERFPGRRFVDSHPPHAQRGAEDEMQQWHQGAVSDVSSKRMSQLQWEQWELPPSAPLDAEPEQPMAGPGPSTVAGWSQSNRSNTSVPYIR